MTKKEAREAVTNKSLIEYIEDSNLWGLITCLSDDETTAYFKPKGASLNRLAAPINQIRVVE